MGFCRPAQSVNWQEPGNQTKRPASHHIVDRLEFSRSGEFEGCTEGISHGKAEKASSIAFP